MDENQEASQPTSAQEAGIDGLEEAMERIRISPRKLLRSLGHLRIDRARIKPIQSKALDQGGTADVEAATLAPAQSSSSSNTDDIEYFAPFAHEVNLLNDLSHENVVKITGFVEDVEHGVAWMVFAWEKNGNLREFNQSTNWELPERVSLIRGVAEGLTYLHGRNPPICHGDMKSLNVLVTSLNRAIITDFGSARPIGPTAKPSIEVVDAAMMTESKQKTSDHAQIIESLKAEVDLSGGFITMTGPAWTVRWAAPELLTGDLPSLASDIWALGWICWEAVTGNFPFEKDTDGVAVIVRITRGDLPAVKNNDQLREIGTLCSLMEECWRVDAKSRPKAMRCRQAQTVPLSREETNSDTPRSSELLHALGWIQRQNNMMPEACEYFQQSLKVSNSVGDERGKARALKALGDAYSLGSEYSKAEESYIQARDI
ncbi:hypothetical protein M407DRAFT_29074 [Tulasnella calospora MUT 4182]|uniref:Protein kinase domain-containing protein n=1 Tax=Tulasnella calospora MUT 4182 TaxID=1051891 RepID=A0A0C3KIH4_9AGAM|nr:hypothetical protein M407DRAFT_29074 [Tulasnella calospora MUT 4182]